MIRYYRGVSVARGAPELPKFFWNSVCRTMAALSRRLQRVAALCIRRVQGVRFFAKQAPQPTFELPENLQVDGVALALLGHAAAAAPAAAPSLRESRFPAVHGISPGADPRYSLDAATLPLASPRELPIVSFATGQPTGVTVALDPRVFETPLRSDIIHRVIVWQEKNARTTLYKAKTRSEVRGGGRKPWKQKGTGRARAGSIRSPLWRGGGVAHAPVFRDWSTSLNKKVRQLGLRVALAAKARDGRVVVVDSLALAGPRTRTLEQALRGPLGLSVGRKRLVLVDTDEALVPGGHVALAARNLPLTVPLPARGVNVRDLVLADRVVITVAGLAALTDRLVQGLGSAVSPSPAPQQ